MASRAVTITNTEWLYQKSHCPLGNILKTAGDLSSRSERGAIHKSLTAEGKCRKATCEKLCPLCFPIRKGAFRAIITPRTATRIRPRSRPLVLKQSHTERRSSMLRTPWFVTTWPVTQEMLLNPSPDDWLMFSRTYNNQRVGHARSLRAGSWTQFSARPQCDLCFRFAVTAMYGKRTMESEGLPAQRGIPQDRPNGVPNGF